MDGSGMASESGQGRTEADRPIGSFRSGRPCRIFRFSVKWGTCPVDDRNWIISSLELGCLSVHPGGPDRQASTVVFGHGCRRAESRCDPPAAERRLGDHVHRKREVQFWSIVFLIGTLVRPALAQTRKPDRGLEDLVGIAVEVQWVARDGAGTGAAAASRRSGAEVTLASTLGQVSEVIAWPPDAARDEAVRPRRGGDGVWQLGPAPSGRIRVRLEVPPGAGAHRPSGGRYCPDPDHSRPGAFAANSSPVSTGRERGTPAVGFLESRPRSGQESGVVAPASVVPVSLRYNILWPETTDVTVRTMATLRPVNGGEPICARQAARGGCRERARSARADLVRAGAP